MSNLENYYSKIIVDSINKIRRGELYEAHVDCPMSFRNAAFEIDYARLSRHFNVPQDWITDDGTSRLLIKDPRTVKPVVKSSVDDFSNWS